MKHTEKETHPQLLLTVPQAAKALGLGCTKVYNLIYYEGLPVQRFGRAVRVPLTALEQWLEQRSKSA